MNKELISVCICTFKRVKALKNCLESIFLQITNDNFLFEIIVVDNDKEKSAESIVESFINNNKKIQIIYDCEPKQNISLARNRAIRRANGNFIAFIDDDEVSERDWLVKLYQSILNYRVHGILGPVLPIFESPPPNWILKSHLFERKRFKTGTTIKDPKYTRTGNVLLLRTILQDMEQPFDPKYGLIGGEDVDFFRRQIMKGFKFVWCNEAIVYERVPINRLKFKYLFKRALLRGISNAKSDSNFSFFTLKSLLAIITYPLILPGLSFAGKGAMARYIIKWADHFGKIGGQLRLFNEKNFTLE